MNKIPTAEEFLEEQKLKIPHNYDRVGIAYSSIHCERKMIEFAQLHVEAALKAAYENQETEQFKKEQAYDYPDSSHFRATKSSILNAYPKELIK